jgi:hypothetical protein
LPAFGREKIPKEGKYFPLLTKGDEGGLDNLFQRTKIIQDFDSFVTWSLFGYWCLEFGAS